MEKVLKRILTAVLAVLMAVTTVQPLKVSADSKDVTLTATTDSGIRVSVVRDGRAYSKETDLVAVDVDSEAVLKDVKKKLHLDELEVQAIDLSYSVKGKKASVSSWYEANVTLVGVKANVTNVLHFTKGLFGNNVEKVEFKQDGDEIAFTHDGTGRYVVVYDKTPVSFESNTNGSETKVTVVADNSAFKEGTEMNVKDVQAETIPESVKGEVVGAVDISFGLDGKEVQPTGEVTVTINKELESGKKYKLVHIHDDGTVEVVDGAEFTEDGVTFAARSFSIYAVVEEEDTGDDARLTVNFINDGVTVATMYVANKDKAIEGAIDTIIYDPGIGTLGDHQLFEGWAIEPDLTKGRTIKDIRTTIAGKTNWAEGDVLNVYAIIVKYYTVTYYAPTTSGGTVSLGSVNVTDNDRNATSMTFTIKESYNPSGEGANNKKFDGWDPILNTSGNIQGHTEGKLYQEEETITITGDVSLQAVVIPGYWLVFDENGKGATYNAPRFYEQNVQTVNDLNDMERVGYEFDGWYYGEPAEVGGDPTGDRFEFGGTLSENTKVYAKWKLKSSANYTIIIWRENISGDGYDFAESIPLSGTPNTNVNTVSIQGTAGQKGSYIRVNGINYNGADGGDSPYTGFHLKEVKPSVNPNINPEGNTVINVYYDRNEYTLNFQIARGYSWTTIKSITAKYKTNISNNFPIVGTNGVTYDNGERWDPQSNSLGWSEVMVYIDTMPSGNVNFHLNQAERPLKTMNYYIEALSGDTGAVDGPNTVYRGTNNEQVNISGKKFVLYKSVQARYNGVTEEDLVSLTGFTLLGADSQMRYVTDAGNYFYIYNTSQNGTLNIYYSRDSYVINFEDGAYIDGDNNPIDEQKQSGFGQSDPELYGADISAYNPGGSKYVTPPTSSDYVFAGWYIDDQGQHEFTFDKMPQGGITVYAKWIQKQYRVFLHSNAYVAGSNPPVLDNTLTSWGDSSVKMSFRVSLGEKISVPKHAIRPGYELIGWYFDEKGKEHFMEDMPINDSLAELKPYDKDVDMTDPMEHIHGTIIDPENASNSDKTGYNGKERFWITKKVELYAKWSAILDGAIGINVIYDVTSDGDSSQVPTDGTFYKDNVQAIAQSAAVAAKPDEKQFSHWVVQKWDSAKNKFVDVEGADPVFPGGEFTVLKAYAHQEVLQYEDDGVTINAAKYTVSLRAEFIDKEEKTPTHITFYTNGGKITGAVPASTDELIVNRGTVHVTYPTLHINEAIPVLGSTVFTRDDWTFVGWARETEPSGAWNETELKVNEGAYTEKSNLKLWLKLNPLAEGATTETYSEIDPENGNVVKDSVTKIAADEWGGFHALYAVWEKTFYIFHSATGKLEAVTVQLTKDEHVNLLDYVTDDPETDDSDFIYGGYYSSYGGVTFTETELKNYKDSARNASNHMVKVDGAVTYNGDSLTVGEKKFWENGNANTNDGTKLNPVSDTVYYLKEVPEAYLSNSIIYIFDKTANNKITTLYLLTTIDDSLYSDVYFKITEKYNATIVSRVSVQQRGLAGEANTVKKYTAGMQGADYDAQTETGTKAINSKIQRGYIGFVKNSELVKPQTFVLTPYWTTLDGVDVSGLQREYTIDSQCINITVDNV